MAPIKPTKGKQRHERAENVSSSQVHQRQQSAHQRRKRPIAATAVKPAKSDVPGVQKIKAALRQTKRLLAKDNLAADVRVKAERRLVSLEDDLAQAEIAKVERTMAVRYHKVKFFERQKAVRKINHLKRDLENAKTSEEEPPSKKQLKSLEKALFEARVDLNYILNYPKTSKYISLYPPQSQDQSSTVHETAEGHQSEDEPDANSNNETAKQRDELRKLARKAMKAGTMSVEPELHLGEKSDSTGIDLNHSENPKSSSRPNRVSADLDSNKKSKVKKTHGSLHDPAPAHQKPTGGVTGDDFFDMDED